MTFKIHQGDALVRTETLSQDIIKVGKLPSSHLRIEDENVSRMHAVIEVTGPEEIYIIDLGSAAGTIVNGKKVNKCKLQNGDEIVLGGTRVVVEIGAASAAATSLRDAIIVMSSSELMPPISTTTRVPPRTISSPFCSLHLLTFLPLTIVPDADPRSMMKISSGPVTSITACIRETLSSSIRRCDDGSLPTLMMSWASCSVRISSSPR
jgi:hypothetical protein